MLVLRTGAVLPDELAVEDCELDLPRLLEIELEEQKSDDVK